MSDIPPRKRHSASKIEISPSNVEFEKPSPPINYDPDKCHGCLIKHPSQKQHMGDNGCLNPSFCN